MTMPCKESFFLLGMVAIVTSVINVSMAKEYIVGDDQGWTIDYNYTLWLQGKQFYVGDTLVFKYTPKYHNVIKACGRDYQACNTSTSSESNAPLTSGDDVVTLSDAGKAYFLCGIANHCTLGQKFAVDVLPANISAVQTPPSSTTPPPSLATPSGVAVTTSGFPAMLVAVVVAAVMLFSV